MSQIPDITGARFHWSEGNKFALEFVKTGFLFNSTLSVALIGFIASAKYSDKFLLCAIASFLIAALIALSSFVVSYYINLFHGNSLIEPDADKAIGIWNNGNELQRKLAIFGVGGIVCAMLIGFTLLVIAAINYPGVVPISPII